MIRVQWVALLQVGLMVGYPLLISLGLSELWLHPFGAATIAHTNRWVVWADWLFSTPTIIPQPVTGVSLPSVAGY